MKNLVLASALGTLAGAFAIPAIGGPVHFAVTRPYSMFGWLPASPNGAPVSVSLGTAPLDFILTDVMFGRLDTQLFVTVNGTPVFNCATQKADAHMTSGIFIAAGSTIGVQGSPSGSGTTSAPVTLAGYVQ